MDPLKDVEASALAVNNRFTSRTDVIAEHSQDTFDSVVQKVAEEEKKAKALGVDLPSPLVLPSAVTKGGDEQPGVDDSGGKGSAKPAAGGGKNPPAKPSAG